ncbi:hypothetical protein [Alteribacter natronophilus]|uniref:hypothetical protein n=1 Tax=Alteribacter natronophilus TaxID=2583810 RepID=UPI00110E03FF|nr:hypothetical protein [Alteribacter natronophilus]TMW70319.1 hypothetical protein FGB90_16725 [Alteribacter natronophilus]
MSTLYHRGRVDPDKLNKLLISGVVLALLATFFLPFVLIAFIQDAVYFSPDHWLFLAPASAFYAIGGAFLWLAFLMLAYVAVYHIRDRRGKEVPYKWAYAAASVFALPLIAFGIANYYYIDESGIHYSALTTFSETSMPWESIESMQPVGDEEDYIAYYLFTAENGDYYMMPYTQDFSQQRPLIMGALEEHGVKMLEQTYEPALP